MSNELAAILAGILYVSALVFSGWLIARRSVTENQMPDDLQLGDRVQQRSAWRDEPLKRGTVTEVYAGVNCGVTLYAVLWDGGYTPSRGHMGGGLEREHQTSGLMQNG